MPSHVMLGVTKGRTYETIGCLAGSAVALIMIGHWLTQSDTEFWGQRSSANSSIDGKKTLPISVSENGHKFTLHTNYENYDCLTQSFSSTVGTKNNLPLAKIDASCIDIYDLQDIYKLADEDKLDFIDNGFETILLTAPTTSVDDYLWKIKDLDESSGLFWISYSWLRSLDSQHKVAGLVVDQYPLERRILDADEMGFELNEQHERLKEKSSLRYDDIDILKMKDEMIEDEIEDLKNQMSILMQIFAGMTAALIGLLIGIFTILLRR